MPLPLPPALFGEFSADSTAAPALWRLRKNSHLSPTSFISQNSAERGLLSRALGDAGGKGRWMRQAQGRPVEGAITQPNYLVPL